MTTHRSPRLWLLAFALTVSLAGAASAEDLRSLRKEYEEAKAKAGGQPKDRGEKVQKTVVPLLEKIGALDTKESLAFLLGELKAAPPEIGAACAGPILASSHDGALKLLLQTAADRPPAVKAGVLAALERTKADLSGAAAEVLHFAQGAQDPEAKKALPPVLARLGTVAAAKLILAGVQPAKTSRGGEDPQAAYNSRAAAALG
ncbi:MAG: hypothetical protein HY721_18355, partial [Planctomycetes bacterium]|nr:hypothetical protein [Planctomycetota bacterium]